ncbi:MAG: hypothetical protein AB7H97_08090 [Pseudobdellovibrionaceae bacterium]
MHFLTFAAGIYLTLSSQFVLAHGGEDRVEIEMESPAKISAGHAVVSFQLVDTKENKVLTPLDLNISHERKLHFVAYDPGLREFQHLHPEFDGKVWNVDADFAVNGNYFIWAQGELSIDSEEFNGLARIEVSGGKNAWPNPALSDVRTGTESGSVATLSSQILKAGKMAMLTLRFTNIDGSPAAITPYLGAFAHIISTGEDGDSLIHIHPMNGGHPNEGMVHVTFPDAGFYRLWVQFIDAGVLKVIPLSVKVN